MESTIVNLLKTCPNVTKEFVQYFKAKPKTAQQIFAEKLAKDAIVEFIDFFTNNYGLTIRFNHKFISVYKDDHFIYSAFIPEASLEKQIELVIITCFMYSEKPF